MLRNIFYSLFTISLVFHFSMENSSPKNSWKLKLVEDDIALYTRSVDYSKLEELKTELTVKSSLGAIVSILDSVELYPEWMYGCREGRNLKIISRNEKLCHTTLNFPNPLSDRNIVSRLTLHQDVETKVITIKSVALDDKAYLSRKMVMIKKMESSWILTPKDNGEVLIEAYLFCDPGGFIPNWLVNKLSYKSPFKTVLNLRKRLAQPEFQDVDLTMIQEKE